jgi:hypothetical protein
MITFTEAIELQDEAPSVDLQKLQAYLETVSPELAAAVRKDFTAADVHVGTALGNQRGRKKPKKLSTVGDGKHQDSADVVSQRDDSWSMTFKILKADADKQHIYGWASVVEENGQLIVDKQDDIIMPADLFDAAVNFMLDFGTMGDMHENIGVGRTIMSFVTTAEMCKAFGMTVENDKVGWIVGFKVDDADVWKLIKDGKRPEFSIGGSGRRVEAA